MGGIQTVLLNERPTGVRGLLVGATVAKIHGLDRILFEALRGLDSWH